MIKQLPRPCTQVMIREKVIEFTDILNDILEINPKLREEIFNRISRPTYHNSYKK